jgi:hypothetical protein
MYKRGGRCARGNLSVPLPCLVSTVIKFEYILNYHHLLWFVKCFIIMDKSRTRGNI